MSPHMLLLLVVAADFLLTWGVLYLAVALLHFVGLPIEATALTTFVGAVVLKLIRLIL